MIDDVSACILAARAELVAARAILHSEIASYPTPIAGCDAQFNHLLAERGRVSAALASLDTVIFVPTPRSPTATAGIESR